MNRTVSRKVASAALLLALGVGLVGAQGAEAVGLCIDQNANSVIFVPRFRAPAKGKCKPYTGIVANGLEGCGASGQACTVSDGSQVLLGLTYFAEGTPRFVEVTLPLPIGAAPAVLRHSTFASYNVTMTTASLCAAP